MLATDWQFARPDPVQRRRYKKKTPERFHYAFRRLNYEPLTLVGKGDAKSRHPEILVVAAVPRSNLHGLVESRKAAVGKSKKSKRVPTLLSNEVELIRMVPL